jgi:adenylate cyclase
MVKTYTNNLEAYNLYLKATYYWYRWTPNDIKKSLELLKQSIKLDPDYALAYSSLSACYVYLGAIGHLPPKDAYPLGKNYALKALSLDETIPACHVSLAMVNFFDWQWDESYTGFMRALSLNPNSADAHLYYSYYQVAMGNIKKAILENEKALEIDPLNVQINCSLAIIIFSPVCSLKHLNNTRKPLNLIQHSEQLYMDLAGYITILMNLINLYTSFRKHNL